MRFYDYKNIFIRWLIGNWPMKAPLVDSLYSALKLQIFHTHVSNSTPHSVESVSTIYVLFRDHCFIIKTAQIKMKEHKLPT